MSSGIVRGIIMAGSAFLGEGRHTHSSPISVGKPLASKGACIRKLSVSAFALRRFDINDRYMVDRGGRMATS